MALSGSFNTTAYSGRYLTFSWSATQDVAANTSTISWSLKGAGGSNIYYKAAPFKVVIAGETVYSSSTRIELYNGTTVASGTKTLQHNSDGNKSFAVSVEAAIYYKSVNCKGSSTFELNPMPVKATITSAPNFTDLDNPTIYYTNPIGTKASDVAACIANANGNFIIVPYRSISKTGTSYTFNFTAAEREALCNAFPNTNTANVRFYVRTVVNGVNYHSYVMKTLTITPEDPDVDIVLRDDNRYTVAATGDSSIFVRGASYAAYDITATAKKGATIASYEITNNGYTHYFPFGTFPGIEDPNFTFKVVDSRGNSVVIHEEVYMIDYTDLTADLSVTTDINAGTSDMSVMLTINGNCFVGEFDEDKPNALELYYQYKVGNGEFGDWVRINNPSVSEETQTYNAYVELNLDYREAYTFRILAKDLVWERYSNQVSIVTKPIFDWSKSDFNFNVPVSINGEPIADFVVATGTTTMGSNGTWYWQKWNSGKAECWGKRNFGNVGFSTAWGVLYRSENFTQTYPSGLFISPPQLSLTVDSATSTCLIATGGENGTNTTSPTFNLIRPNTTTMSQAYINFYVVGRWK